MTVCTSARLTPWFILFSPLPRPFFVFSRKDAGRNDSSASGEGSQAEALGVDAVVPLYARITATFCARPYAHSLASH